MMVVMGGGVIGLTLDLRIQTTLAKKLELHPTPEPLQLELVMENFDFVSEGLRIPADISDSCIENIDTRALLKS